MEGLYHYPQGGQANPVTILDPFIEMLTEEMSGLLQKTGLSEKTSNITASILLIGGSIVVAKKLPSLGNKVLKKDQATLYRAVSQAELDDIAAHGIRNASGYETGKLFATSAQDAANFGRLNYGFDKQPFSIIQTSLSSEYSPMLYKGEMDLMQATSVPSNLFKQLSKPNVLNSTPPLPNHPWIIKH